MGVLRTFEQSCKSAADASQKQLLSILKDNADTEYGKKYHFSDISSVSEYKKQVPFSTFEDYEDFGSFIFCGDHLGDLSLNVVSFNMNIELMLDSPKPRERERSQGTVE